MDCNKEEAVRAKMIAEKKMQASDFAGAKKILLRAQQLHKDLENVSQMLTVCEVHCSSELKCPSSERDWYGILQVAQTADEGAIKKQYRKLALVLHPDKNKFAGAESAFKLIGEAQRVLSDQQKRSLYDMKRRAPLRSRQPAQPQNRAQNVTPVPVVPQTQFTGVNLPQRQQAQHPQPGVANGQPTFWTACPFCTVRYQYYTNIVNRALRCQSCTKPFIAHDLNVQGGPVGPNSNLPGFHQQPLGKNIGNGNGNIGPKSNVGPVPPRTGMQWNASNGTTPSNPSVKTNTFKANAEANGVKGGVNGVSVKEGKTEEKSKSKVKAGKPNTSKKRGRSEEESSLSSVSGSSNDTAFGDVSGSGFAKGLDPRRSHRQKQNVSYDENGEDDDFVSPKKSKGTGRSNIINDQNEGSMAEKAKVDKAASINVEKERSSKKAEDCNPKKKEAFPDMKNEKSTSNVGGDSESEIFAVADAEFYDFDKDRSEDCFAANQMWAVYDTLDGMPRFYAIIRKVLSPGFKVRMTWLTTDFDDEKSIKWSDEELPSSCGRFKIEKNETTDLINQFSHRVLWEKGPGRNSYIMRPKKDEIWALFKNWDLNWSDDPEKHQNFEFTFVKVQSDYVDGLGLTVAYLEKLKGFVSLFRLKKETEPLQIPPHELLRFSHGVPSYRTTGTEREDVPEGCFELDPASVPENIEATADLEDVEHKIKGTKVETHPETVEAAADLEDVEQKIKSTKFETNGSCSKPPCKNSPFREGLRRGIQSNDTNAVDEGHLKNACNLPSSNVSPSTKETIPDDIKASLSSEEHVLDPTPSTKKTIPDVINASLISENQSLDPTEIPASEFHDFEDERSRDKFQPGQIWALYCDLDGLPKYYCRINRVETSPEFTLHITWLEESSLLKNMTDWSNAGMPVCCGTFIASRTSATYKDTDSFSHLLTKLPNIKSKKIEIYPKKGEVWAVYRNFSLDWRSVDLQKCEYDLVEIIEGNSSSTKMLLLGIEDGFDTVYRIKKKSGEAVTMEINMTEFYRFSHKVPAFRLMGERDGSLKGCWELDPKSIPVCLFRYI